MMVMRSVTMSTEGRSRLSTMMGAATYSRAVVSMLMLESDVK